MIEFWQEVWEYLGTLPVEIASRQISNMWEAKEAIFDGKAAYEYLCMICRNISDETKMGLPDNLHARMVLGEKNRYVQEYLSHRGA